MALVNFIKSVLKTTNWKEFRVCFSYCPVCSRTSVFVRSAVGAIGVRCLICQATGIHMSVVAVLSEVVPRLASKHVYELSSRGALFKYLRKNAGSLTYSEYFDDVILGEYKNHVQCQNVQNLTYDDCSFDICTSTEVFEHVSNDMKGFSEIFRVLKPNGVFIFTVPLNRGTTIERTKQHPISGELEYLLPPVYHGDQMRGLNKVLVFRDFGFDIVDRIKISGFAKAEILTPDKRLPWGYKAPVIVAYK